ncbi:MAG: glutamate--tRNA ligase [Alphaproteobacteria bacterium]|nr:glutamate--tRNA ligase [Alphaproteobacteria bacterium]
MADTLKNTDSPPVVRFAPSPTGYLHIGGARTALFNWLYAKANSGRFLLRIEDTDRARNNPDAVKAIADGLHWLGLDWEGDAVSQFARAERHAEVAHELLTKGQAYRCYLTPDELADMRKQAEAEKRAFKIRSPWRDKGPDDGPKNQPYSVRLKMPQTGETVVEDKVQGPVTFANQDLDDFILLRSDGSPTYHLAVVVDDHDMGVTHVIRGVDHLNNAARQSQIYVAMDWPLPVWAHVPLIHGSDGAKLSKRHGALGVEAYRAMGYLPEALRNYLVRLGWSHGDDEIMSTAQLIDWFGLDGIGKSPARFDTQKLEDLNAHYIRDSDDDALLRHIQTLLPEMEGGSETVKKLAENDGWTKLKLALPGLKPRAKTLCAIVEGAAFITAERPLTLEPKAAKLLDDDAKSVLAKLRSQLETVDAWQPQTLEDAVRSFAEDTGLKLGKVAQPMRAALTGRTVSPPVFDVMAVLGRSESLARLADQSS